MLVFGRNKRAGRLRAALLAGATVVALGAGGLSASGAAAAPSCTGANISGVGASLQVVVQQQVWTPGFAGFCGAEPKVTYLGGGSGAGLAAWDFNGPDGKAFDTSVAYTATDDAPTATQIENAKAAAPGSNEILVIPVAQTSIGVAVNPPAECSVEFLTNKNLEEVFRGTRKKWGQLDTAIGEGCAGKDITRVVRFDGSGTTYQFKNYLNLINKNALACTEPSATWKDLQPIGVGGKPNTTWPENGKGGCSATTLSPVVTGGANGNAVTINKVDATDGSIGYASLADIELNKDPATTNLVQLQNNGTAKISEASFAEAGTEAGNANCSAARYLVPEAGQIGGSGENVDWSQVFGAKTNIGGLSYPLCTLTFDMALKGYAAAGFSAGATTTVIDFLREYVTAADGQEDVENAGKFYSPLPTSTKAKYNVLGAALLAASKIE